MNEVLLDQIPALSGMLRSLEQLSIMSVPERRGVPVVINQVPVALEQIERDVEWGELVERFRGRLRSSRDEEEREHMMRLAELYSNSNVEGLMEGFKCGRCGKEAFKRCSKCKEVWYCSRECQVGDWGVHKVRCNERGRELKLMEERIKNKEINCNKPNLIN
jgi:hypothetical protein